MNQQTKKYVKNPQMEDQIARFVEQKFNVNVDDVLIRLGVAVVVVNLWYATPGYPYQIVCCIVLCNLDRL
jgi:hypothetical protein